MHLKMLSASVVCCIYLLALITNEQSNLVLGLFDEMDSEIILANNKSDRICCFVCSFMSQSTAMVMSRWSVDLTTLFPG